MVAGRRAPGGCQALAPAAAERRQQPGAHAEPQAMVDRQRQLHWHVMLKGCMASARLVASWPASDVTAGSPLAHCVPFSGESLPYPSPRFLLLFWLLLCFVLPACCAPVFEPWAAPAFDSPLALQAPIRRRCIGTPHMHRAAGSAPRRSEPSAPPRVKASWCSSMPTANTDHRVEAASAPLERTQFQLLARPDGSGG